MESSLRILLLEDQATDAELIERELRKIPLVFTARRVQTQSEFSEALQAFVPHLVLADYSLPGFDGLAALAMTHAASPETPFIFVTGTMGEEVAVESLKSGATDYVLKHRLSRLGPSVRRALREIEGQRKSKQMDNIKAYLADIVESTEDAIFGVTPDGRIVSWNRGAEQLYGYTADEVIGQPVEILAPADRAGDVRENLELVKRGLRVRGKEAVRCRKDGTLIDVALTISPIKSSTGEIVGFSSIIRDIAERKRAEAELRETNRRLEVALLRLKNSQQIIVDQERMRALGQMASGIAHDFNNALAPILGFSELLLAHPDLLAEAPKVTSYLEMMHTAAKDASEIVRRMREFYRPHEHGERFHSIDLNEVVTQAIALAQPRWKDQALGEGRTITVVAHCPAIPAVLGSASQLREVVANLIFNAVDAMPDGGTITCRTRAEEEFVRLEVSDTGTGMGDDVRRRCFEPFFTTKGHSGTGLGLSMAYGIVQRHGGTMAIESGVGRGTVMIIRIPVASETAPAAKLPLPEAEIPEKALRVLLVDDEPMARMAVQEYLVNDGHIVETAGSAAEGLAKFQAGRFDLVVTDRAMPEMSGDQLAARLKKMAPSTPIILLTGFGGMMQAVGERPAGVDLVLGKPVALAVLRQALATAMGWELPGE